MMVKKSVVKVALAFTLLALFAAIGILVVVSDKAHAAGLPVLKHGIDGPKAAEVFAERVQKSLNSDPKGHVAIEDGTCGYNPLNLYQSLREFHPELKWSENPSATDLLDMVTYLQTLQRVHLSVGGSYRNSRMLQQSGSCTMDLSWTRTLPKDEMVWVDRNTGKPILKDNCGNVIGPLVQAPTPAPVAASMPTRACPNGWTLTANAWSLKKIKEISPDLGAAIESAIVAAHARDTHEAELLEAFETDDAVSRKYGKLLREKVKDRAPITAIITVREVTRDPQTRKVSTTDLDVLSMTNGIGSLILPGDPRQYIVGTVWPTEKFLSPEPSGPNKERQRRLRLSGKEWGNWCEMNVHGIVP